MKPNLGSGIPWTKVPNHLIDRLMPTLKDTELRILLVLVRSTSGWNREGSSVPLTYRALVSRTGRHTEAIAGALRSLRDKRLIHTPEPRKARIPKTNQP